MGKGRGRDEREREKEGVGERERDRKRTEPLICLAFQTCNSRSLPLASACLFPILTGGYCGFVFPSKDEATQFAFTQIQKLNLKDPWDSMPISVMEL